MLMSELCALYAHARRWLPGAQLRIVEHRNRELHALLLEVHHERVAREEAAPVVARVELHLRVPRVVLLDQPELAEPREQLVDVRVVGEARHVHRGVL